MQNWIKQRTMKHNKLEIAFIILFLLFTSVVKSQNKIDTMDRVNKFIGIEIGPKMNLKASPDTLAGSGFGVMIEYGWQVSGFNGKKKRSFISVPLGYSYIIDNKNKEMGRQLNYGWAVTHELTKDTNFIPFIGYGLLLNQYTYENMKGSIFGHQSKFEFGINYYLNNRWVFYGKLDYSYLRFPIYNENKSSSIHQAEVKFGIKYQF